MDIDKLIEEHPWSIKRIRCNYINYTTPEWVKMCIEHETGTVLAKHLGCSPCTIINQTKKFTEVEKGSSTLFIKFLRVLRVKKCSKCRNLKELSNFCKDKYKKDKLKSICKKCANVSNKTWRYSERGKEVIQDWRHSKGGRLSLITKSVNTRAAKLQRTPAWADLNSITDFYLKSPKGYHVDHIIPLQGEKVSGLHVLENLQYLTAAENFSKGYKFDIERQQ